MSHEVNVVKITDAAAARAKVDALKGRATQVALAFQSAIPTMSTRPVWAQEEYLLVMSDLKLLQHLIDEADQSANGLAALAAAGTEQAEGLAGDLVAMAQAIAEQLVESLGVSKEAILPAVSKIFDREIELLETVVARAEKSIKEAASNRTC